ncbi:MAG: cystathionine gamma-synthase [Elusimicrobia bacterium GWA2_69_24]|nr:MAG: cystathionine gamma-synthase [Elusimicrobia bacterium GWA2_69_24]HBL15940.1 cystathionine gamma-synthase [Elusimicrobiota bacterium]
MRFETRAIHAGQEPDPVTGAVTVPVYQTSTFQQDGIGKPRGYEYARTGNPTRTALETALASLEGGRYGLAFASGLAATAAVVNLLQKGDHVVAGSDIYGGTYRLFEQVFAKWGLEVSYADVDDPAAFAAAVRPATRLIWVETPTNPLLKIVDVRRLAAVARRSGALLAVDNTFASPYFQRPLELGADLAVHSTTKYLAGHSDLIGGAVVCGRKGVYERLKFHQNAEGAVPGPWDCWLVLRGVKTLPVRMREHEANALAVARALRGHRRVSRVYYPGLADHPGHRLARRQMGGFGGMVSLDLRGGRKAVERFFSRLRIFCLAESLGGVESLVCYPSVMTHGSLPEAERLRRGIGDSLVRLSVGLESREDLLEDLRQALG